MGGAFGFAGSSTFPPVHVDDIVAAKVASARSSPSQWPSGF
jgi:hypothetical protein